MLINEFTVLTQSYHQPELVEILIRSFEKYKPIDFKVKYIVIEGSNDTSYKERILNLANNIQWYNNSSADRNNPIMGASTANGENLEFGKKYIDTDFAFVCHNDVAVLSSNFYKVFQEYSKKYDLISACKDNGRINACHISGLFIKNEILQNVNCMPLLPRLDVGDTLTLFCIENNINYISLPNTHNNPEIIKDINNWRQLDVDCGIDMCIVDKEIIFMHLGRGTPKRLNAYTKSGKISYNGWQEIHKNLLNEKI